MIKRSPSLRHSVVLVVLAVNIFTLVACSSSTGSTAMAPTLEPGDRGTSSGPITVDDPACSTSTCANEITGINDGDGIVGNYTQCSGSSCNSQNWNCIPHSSTTGSGCRPCPLLGGVNKWHSYTSSYNGGYSSFTDTQFPDAPQGQYLYAISDALITHLSAVVRPSVPETMEVGCINPFAGNDPGGGEENGYWALQDNNGLWGVHDQGSASGCAIPKKVYDETEELLGYDLTNATPTAVGFYSAQDCTFKAGEIQAGGDWNGIPVHLTPFSQNVMATGITGSTATTTGSIVGIATATTGTPNQEGWYIPSGTGTGFRSAQGYYVTGSSATAFTGIATVNGVVTIVGWYTTPASAGHPASTHGLVATPSTGGFSVSPPIDVGVGLTMINGVNMHGDICGWYTDSSGKYHGFVWLGKAATALRKRHRHGSRAKTQR